MKSFLSILFLCFFISINGQDQSPVQGTWDLQFEVDGKQLPSWLEIKHSGHATYVGRFVYAMGSARPISEVEMSGDRFYFEIPRQWEPEGGKMKFEGFINDAQDSLRGNMTYTDGKVYYFTGIRAPEFKYTADPKWGKKLDLFNGKDLSGWKTGEGANNWKVEEGILINEKSGANLISEQKFKDFKLHAEFRYPKESNSGIYLRGRYEVQIADNKGMSASDILFAGIYGFLTPNQMAAKDAGEWQTFDITLIGNRVTIIANGIPVIVDQVIPGITGGALDSKEGEPGPFMIQGDHGAIQFRAFEVTPGVK